ncbi:general transcription factor IIH subunit 2-like isoform X2 [Hylaeus volcanicus]|uniref:general transcription factor IIH subunit 2-like isoform X2 n=1 Tax=Hylaeus volcanicus TaxID=313075 RepID=UPI0023B86F59|nr:general transcription factor IIH subunit 2-like isoform X2 [Hylaeus volcanicus]
MGNRFLQSSEKTKQISRETLCEKNPTAHLLIRKGTLRNVVILLDASESMQETDYKPNRIFAVLSAIEEILPIFFRSNPLCRVGFIILLHSQGVPICSLNNSLEELLQFLKLLRERDIAGGTVSLLNGFKKCAAMLSSTPPYATREVVVMFGSINSCDSGNIQLILKMFATQGIQISVISLTPELFILRTACTLTGGSYRVVKSQDELKECLKCIENAPNWTNHGETRLVPMGFPKPLETTIATLCMCHNRVSLKGYLCPRCRGKVCSVPTKCVVCDLHIASFLNIARTTKHYAPVLRHTNLSSFEAVCYMCETKICSSVQQCTSCENYFCRACQDWRVSVLQQCPGCMVPKQTIVPLKDI